MVFYLLRFITFFRRSIVPYVCHFDLGLDEHNLKFTVKKNKPNMQIVECNRQTERIGSQMKSFCVCVCVVFVFCLFKLSFFLLLCSVLSNKCDFYIYPCYWLEIQSTPPKMVWVWLVTIFLSLDFRTLSPLYFYKRKWEQCLCVSIFFFNCPVII